MESECPDVKIHPMAIHLDDDDRAVGRLLTRREVLALFGTTAGGALLVACAPSVLISPAASAIGGASAHPSASGVAGLPSCIVRPELTEGPYFVDEKLNRSDIRSDPDTGVVEAGATLALAYAVSRIDASSCTPFAGALVDVWHCNALGVYSDVNDPSGSTVGQQFLRGYQVTDADGMARFITVYPGWYSGRAVHIHFKIRTDAGADAGLEFTSQLFFDDAQSAAVYSRDPYAAKGTPDTPNSNDGIYGQSGGQTLLTVVEDGDGYASTFEIGIQVD
jgi:protocatechuate 3,4-dioxygenase beta subunit